MICENMFSLDAMRLQRQQKQAGRDRVGRKLVDSVLGTSSGIIVRVALHHTDDIEHTNIRACHVVPCVHGKFTKYISCIFSMLHFWLKF